MKGLEGVSDSDFHGWTVPRYTVLTLRRAQRWRREPRRPWATEYIYGGGKDGTDLFLKLFHSEEFADAHIHETRGGSTGSHGSYHALGRPILRSPGAE